MSTKNILNRANNFRVFYALEDGPRGSDTEHLATAPIIDKPKSLEEILQTITAELQRANDLNEQLSQQVGNLQGQVDYMTAPISVKIDRSAKHLKNTAKETAQNGWSKLKDANAATSQYTQSKQLTTGTLGGDLKAVGSAIADTAQKGWTKFKELDKAVDQGSRKFEKDAGKFIAGTAIAGAVGAYKAGETLVKGAGKGIAMVTGPTVAPLSRAFEAQSTQDVARLSNRINERNEQIGTLDASRATLDANAYDEKSKASVEAIMNSQIDAGLLNDVKMAFTTFFGDEIASGKRAIPDLSKITTPQDLHNHFMQDGTIDSKEEAILNLAINILQRQASKVDLNSRDMAKLASLKAANTADSLGKKGLNIVDGGRKNVAGAAANVASVLNMDVKDIGKGISNFFSGGKKQDKPASTSTSTRSSSR